MKALTPRARPEGSTKELKALRSLRLTQSAYDDAVAKARQSGMTFSAYTAAALAGSQVMSRRSIPPEQFRQLAAWGNNLNQIARRLNQAAVSGKDYETLTRELIRIRRSVKAISEAMQ